MSILWLLVILLIVFAVVGAPGVGPWHHGYGYYPSGIGTVLVIILILWLLGVFR